MSKKKSAGPSSSVEVRVIEALKSPKYKYRTAHGISRETNIAPVKVIEVLQSSPSVRKSLTRAADGSKLYALKKKVSTASDVWTSFKAINGAKFGD
jgi:hypothetical protein